MHQQALWSQICEGRERACGATRSIARAKHMGSADCVATRLLARRFCEPRRALRTSTKGNEAHKATTGGCTKGSAKAQAPHEPTGVARRVTRKPSARTNPREQQTAATQSGDLFCFALKLQGCKRRGPAWPGSGGVTLLIMAF